MVGEVLFDSRLAIRLRELIGITLALAFRVYLVLITLQKNPVSNECPKLLTPERAPLQTRGKRRVELLTRVVTPLTLITSTKGTRPPSSSLLFVCAPQTKREREQRGTTTNLRARGA